MNEPDWNTSETDPLRIDAVQIPGTSARLGMTLCPGKTQDWGKHAAWNRALDADLAVIERWGASMLITLIEDHEFDAVGVGNLPERARAHGLRWYHWPIRDHDRPDARFERCWRSEFPAVRERLTAGESLVLHCMGGNGRTGTVAARILIEFGTAPETAVRQVRAARPGAIETAVQLRYVTCNKQER